MLPAGVDADAIKAGYGKGILTVRITMPEAVEQEPKRIAVQK